MHRRVLLPWAAVVSTLPTVAIAGPEGAVVQNPHFDPSLQRVELDFRPGARNKYPLIEVEQASLVPFDRLDDFIGPDPEPDPSVAASLPEGMAQLGGMVVPEAMLDGADMVGNTDAFTTESRGPLANKEEFCAYPEAVPAGVYDGDPRPGGEVPRRYTIYLNFTGGVLYSGGENSAENMSGIARSGHMYPVFSGGEAKAIATAQAVMADFQYWQTRIVYEKRPPKILPYTMVMVGGSYTDTTSGPAGGVAPLDCEDFGQRNVCYSFTNSQPAISQANVISQEVGHTMGLGHTEGTDRIMGAGYAGAYGDLIFGNNCTSIIQVQGQGAACVGVNKCHCGDANIQHDRNTLSVTYAPPVPDEIPPQIELLEPADCAMYPVGEAPSVKFVVSDNYGGYGWKIVVKDAITGEVLADQVDYDRLTEFNLVGLPEGVYEITGEIQDQADLTATDSRYVVVGTPANDPVCATNEETGTVTESGTDSSGTAGETDTDSGTGGESAGVNDANDGCACRSPSSTSSSAGGPSWLALVLGLFGLARRRRRFSPA